MIKGIKVYDPLTNTVGYRMGIVSWSERSRKWTLMK